MRVLHVLHNSLPYICGYSIRSGYIVRLQRSAGHDVKVLTSAQHPNGPEMREEIDGIEHRRTPSYGGKPWPLWREWWLMRRLARQIDEAIDEWRPDLVHAHSPLLVGLPTLRAARRRGIPFVYEVRDFWENALVDQGRFGYRSFQYRVARYGETHVLSKADAVVTICGTLETAIRERLGSRGRIQVVPNGVDVEAFRPRAPSLAVRRKLGLDGKRVILYLGTFQPYEGLEVLVRSLRRILAQRSDVHLLIAGGSASLAYRGATLRGTQEEVLGRVVSELQLAAHLTMTGHVPHQEAADLYSVADCLVYPRILTRTTSLTTPLKPLEAMAMGKAVAVSDLPPMRELVRNGENGVTFTAGDEAALAQACIALLDDAALRDRLGRAARDFVVAERQWSDLVGRYRAPYEQARATSSSRWS